MAIINFSFKKTEIPPNAANVKQMHNGAGYTGWIDGKPVQLPGPTALYTWETHIGLCLKDIEENGYDDSDFIMLVWNPEKQIAERICFASTRGWSYPAYNSYVDATSEVRAAYEAKCKKTRKKHLAQSAWDVRKSDIFISEILKIQRKYVTKLRKSFNASAAMYRQKKNGEVKFTWDRTFNSKNHATYIRLLNLICNEQKTEFKQSLKQQVLDWMKDSNSDYRSPLSEKQMQYI